MNQGLQQVAQTFFLTRKESDYNKYFNAFYSILVSHVKKNVTGDNDIANTAVSETMTRMYTSSTFEFNNDKSHLSYLMTAVYRRAIALHKRGRKYICESALFTDDDEGGNNPMEHYCHQYQDNDDWKNTEDGIDEIADLTIEQIKAEFANNYFLTDACEVTQAAIMSQTDDSVTYDNIKEKYGLNSLGVIKSRVKRFRNGLEQAWEEYQNYLNWQNGHRITGPFRIYDKDYNMVATGKLVDGVLQGEYIEYFNVVDGTGCQRKRLKCNYKNGMIDGDYIIYRVTGKREAKYEYVDGKRHGLLTIYKENGRPDASLAYYNDEFIMEVSGELQNEEEPQIDNSRTMVEV
jgi:antitoxin component YwqK of YwqJK toxin-antitoxin module